MANSRREFVKQTIMGSIAIPALVSALGSCKVEESKKNLEILILGGTSFLGPHQIAYALERGHKVSTFTRGKTKPNIHTDIFDKVEQLIGDRENDLTALENRTWDVVIDNSGQKVEWTQKTAELLKNKVKFYLYTSSTGVFYPYLDSDIKEDHSLVFEMPTRLDYEGEEFEYSYGIMKAKSEIATKEAFGEERSIIVRPTYMFGPGDQTNRFIHWPIRLAKGGEVLVPGKADDPVQYVDVRDIAEWMIRLAEGWNFGTFNAAGPAESTSMPEFVAEASKAFEVETNIVQVDDYKFLKDNDIPYLIPWILPEGGNYGSARINNNAAIAKGLIFRSLPSSVKDMHDWWYSDALANDKRMLFEQDPQGILVREADLLKKWKESRT